MKRLIVLRKTSQAIFFALFVYILWSTTYPLEGALPPGTFFKTNPLVTFVTSISERVLLPGVAFSLAMLILTVVFGRFFCGWVCPLGAVIDAAGAFKGARYAAPKGMDKKMRLPKFFILAAVFLLSIAGVQLAWLLDPMVIMARFVSLNLIPTVTSALNNIFILLMTRFGLYGALYDFYRSLRGSILGINVYYFSHSWAIFLFFLLVIGGAFFLKRFWCRSLCPLGALYALAAGRPFLRRVADGCTSCGVCVDTCRMNAIEKGAVYRAGECILCMDCVYDCPENAIAFKWGAPRVRRNVKRRKKGGVTRRNFLVWLAGSSAFLAGFEWRPARRAPGVLIRPPAALSEDKFVDRCIRCGNCMKVCITNGLQPTLFEAGLSGIWTPRLVPEIGYCEYQCTLCGEVCSTGAIPRITVGQKRRTRLGIAEIDRSTCLPHSEGIECIVCEEHCPIPDKAIKLEKRRVGLKTISVPYVDKDLCVGCGICQNKCPVRPDRAIKVKKMGHPS